mmetsp:Transcript_103480/g.278166  ORF Transcript_103480/g.278166 Transcript_103480/m.278166 type:complete len:302 (+) Transcript_103480:299-1204(+)
MRPELALGNLVLHVERLELLALFLDLLGVLRRLALQSLDLLLKVLDPALAAGIEVLDVFLQQLDLLLELLLLLRHVLERLLQRRELFSGLLQRGLGGVVRAAADGILHQGELVLPHLELLLQRRVLGRRGLVLLELGAQLLVLGLLGVDLPLHLLQRLQLLEDAATPGRGAPGEGALGIVGVALLGDRPHADVWVEGHLLGGLGGVADQRASENELHHGLDVLLEADDLKGPLHVAPGRHHVPRLPHDVRVDGPVLDLVERDDVDAVAQLAWLEERFSRGVGVRHDEVQPAAGHNLQGAVI